MKKKSFKRSLKAVSPVIATIIIVAIAIVMAIAVAYWMLGLGGAFTRYEKLEIPTAYAIKNEEGNFTVHLTLKNTGSAPLTVDTNNTLFNGKPETFYGAENITWSNYSITLEPGQALPDVTITLTGTDDKGNDYWQSGMTVEIMVHTVAGKDYPKVVVLP